MRRNDRSRGFPPLNTIHSSTFHRYQLLLESEFDSVIISNVSNMCWYVECCVYFVIQCTRCIMLSQYLVYGILIRGAIIKNDVCLSYRRHLVEWLTNSYGLQSSSFWEICPTNKKKIEWSQKKKLLGLNIEYCVRRLWIVATPTQTLTNAIDNKQTIQVSMISKTRMALNALQSRSVHVETLKWLNNVEQCCSNEH